MKGLKLHFNGGRNTERGLNEQLESVVFNFRLSPFQIKFSFLSFSLGYWIKPEIVVLNLKLLKANFTCSTSLPRFDFGSLVLVVEVEDLTPHSGAFLLYIVEIATQLHCLLESLWFHDHFIGFV